MRRQCFLAVVSVLFLLIGTQGLLGAPSSDAPVFVVDPTAAGTTAPHVFASIPAAIVWLNGAVPNSDGATLVIYPGVYVLPATQNIAVRGLTIVARDGPDKTQVAGDGLANLFTVSAEFVCIDGLKFIKGQTASTTAITVKAPDCEVRDVVVTSLTGTGIVSVKGADRLIIEKTKILDCGVNGITLSGTHDATVTGCEIQDNNGTGLAIVTDCDGASIVGNVITGNKGGGVAAAASRSVLLTQNKIADNGAAGVSLKQCSDSSIAANSAEANDGFGVALESCSHCTVEKNTFVRNAGGIKDSGTPGATSASVGNEIRENTVEGEAAAASSAVALEGNVHGTSVTSNTLSKNTNGVVLLPLQQVAPRGNRISGNTITDVSGIGINISTTGTNGGNVIEGNTVSKTNQAGIDVAAAAPSTVACDTIRGNVVTSAGTFGILVRAVKTSSVALVENAVENAGGDGISVTGDVDQYVNLVANIVRGCSGSGISIANCPYARVEGNIVTGNEGIGAVGGVPQGGVVLFEAVASKDYTWIVRANDIRDNHGTGLVLASTTSVGTTVAWVSGNSISANRRGGVAVNLVAGAAPAIRITSNNIFANQSFGLSLQNLTVPTTGVKLAGNWWGDVTGPSGLFFGCGNALLGLPFVPPDATAPAPILPAPVSLGPGVGFLRVLDVGKAQASVISSFEASTVTVDCSNSASVRLTFSGVAHKDSSWVNLAAFVPEILSTEPFSAVGQVIAAAAVLVTGICDGTAQISFHYDPASLPEGADSRKLRIYLYQDGGWKTSSAGAWGLSGGQWNTLECFVSNGSEVVIGAVPVADLLGRTKVIALVLEK